MKKNEFIILFGLILLGFSVHQISYTIYNISWASFNDIQVEWNVTDTSYIVWLILAPIVVLRIGGGVRSGERKQGDVPTQKAIESMKFCTHCRNQNPKPALHCINCGEKFPI